jgi:cytoskeletal protein CcmA (bactofilin family)
VVGGHVDIHGPVAGDVRIIAGDVVITEPVAGDVFVIGGTVRVLSSASIGGDLLVYGGDVDMSASVAGEVIGRANTLRIDAPVKGAVEVTTDALTFGDRAAVDGTVRYTSATVFTRAQNAVINGDVVRLDPVHTSTPNEKKTALIPILITLFSTLVWFLLGKRFLPSIITATTQHTLRSLLVGIIGILTIPIIGTVLVLSLLGTIVGILVFCVYIALICVALMSGGIVVGEYIMSRLQKGYKGLSVVSVVVGVITLALVSYVPVVGGIIIFGLFITLFGATIERIFSQLYHKH